MIYNSQFIKKQFTENKLSWIKSSELGLSVDQNSDPIPWYCYDAIKFVKSFINKNHKIFEFGCGSSTLFFTNHCDHVISLESNEIWLKIITDIIVNQFEYKLINNSSKAKIIDDDLENILFIKNNKILDLYLLNQSIKNNKYQKFIENFEVKFDLIIIDSLKRFESAINSIKHLKPDGIIILDDSQRKNYQKIFNFFIENNFKKIDFTGIAPGQLRIKKTTIFYRNL